MRCADVFSVVIEQVHSSSHVFLCWYGSCTDIYVMWYIITTRLGECELDTAVSSWRVLMALLLELNMYPLLCKNTSWLFMNEFHVEAFTCAWFSIEHFYDCEGLCWLPRWILASVASSLHGPVLCLDMKLVVRLSVDFSASGCSTHCFCCFWRGSLLLPIRFHFYTSLYIVLLMFFWPTCEASLFAFNLWRLRNICDMEKLCLYAWNI